MEAIKWIMQLSTVNSVITALRGMKWGVRRFRKESGRLTPAGKKRYADDTPGAKSKKSDQDQHDSEYKKARAKKAIAIGSAAVGTALAAYGAYKASELLKQKAYNHAFERSFKAGNKYADRLWKQNVSADLYMRNATSNARKIMDLEEKLLDSHRQYAKRASSNIVAAGKELLGKNAEIPVAVLLGMGIKVFGFEEYR